jgi:hypothetical protein
VDEGLSTKAALAKTFVIPAKAGIHGLTGGFELRRMCQWIVRAMDSRFRGNDKIGND